ncbi:type II secretion system minor pseudopilin GspK [Paraglaciecola sp.]|uniref:type II secretion system minor pseudopilin GspK n=1 Tax=Paraglaciecola sp. TaxID=1920173 RepID=UPI0030F4A5D1
MIRPSKQRGVALIIVLLIVAIVSVLATEMGGRLQLQVKRAANIKNSNQAYWYAIGAEQYASKSIKTLIAESNGVIHLNQPWSEKFVFPIEGGGIEAQLIDMQACFNLNGLKDTTSTDPINRSPELTARLAAFKRLLTDTGLDIADFTADTVRDSLADWLDSDDNMSQLGAEDSEYEGRQFPYLAANNFMADKSELRLINGVESKWLQAVLDWLCVLPATNQFILNVNTVTEKDSAVFAAMTGLTQSEAADVIGSRPPEGFKTVEEFLAVNQIQTKNLSDEQKAWFEVKTEYFMLKSKTRYNNATFSLHTLFKVDKGNVTVISRQFGGF